MIFQKVNIMSVSQTWISSKNHLLGYLIDTSRELSMSYEIIYIMFWHQCSHKCYQEKYNNWRCLSCVPVEYLTGHGLGIVFLSRLSLWPHCKATKLCKLACGSNNRAVSLNPRRGGRQPQGWRRNKMAIAITTGWGTGTTDMLITVDKCYTKLKSF